MQISGITYVKRKKKWFSRFLLTVLILLVVISIVLAGLLVFTNINIPYISEWLEH